MFPDSLGWLVTAVVASGGGYHAAKTGSTLSASTRSTAGEVLEKASEARSNLSCFGDHGCGTFFQGTFIPQSRAAVEHDIENSLVVSLDLYDGDVDCAAVGPQKAPGQPP